MGRLHKLDGARNQARETAAAHAAEIQPVKNDVIAPNQTAFHTGLRTDPLNVPAAASHLSGHSQARHHMSAGAGRRNHQFLPAHFFLVPT